VQTAFSAGIAACALAAVASLFAYLSIDPSGRRTPYLIFAAVFCLHPFTTEIFTFSQVTLFVNLSLAAGLLGALFLLQAKRVEWLIGAALIVSALSIYQITLHYIMIALLLAGVGSLMRGESPISAVRAIVATVISTALCLMIAKGINAALHIPSEARGSFAGLGDLRAKASVFADALVLAFAPPHRLVPPIAAWLAAICAAGSLAAVLWMIARKRGLALALLATVALVGALISVALLPVASSVVWLVPRVLSAISVFVGGLLALGWIAGGHRFRQVLSVATVILAFAYISADNRILFDQWRVNQWDARQGNRMIARLESLPEFKNVETVVALNGHWRHAAPLPTAYGDLNLTIFVKGPAHYVALQQLTGYKFRAPTQAETAAGEEYCKNGAKWPEPAAVTILGATGIVCLGR
jgi:hypothetical protein